MNNWEQIEYDQISEDWRHRDKLTWQIPSLIVIIGGALIVAAFTKGTPPFVTPILLGFGAGLSLCLTFALCQNLWYQVGSGEALKKLVNGKGNSLPKDKLRRALSPKNFNICILQFIGLVITQLTGSVFLLIVCIIVTCNLVVLFFQEIAKIYGY